MLSSTRVGIRSLRAVVFAIGILFAVPAVSQAATAAPGIAFAGTVPGTYNGNPVTVSVATTQGCIPGTSAFVAIWSTQMFKESTVGQNDACSNFNPSGPQSVTFSGNGVPGGTLSSGDIEGPGSPNGNPDTISFTIVTATGGVLIVSDQNPGPLQGAPGRDQAYTYGGPPINGNTQTTSAYCGLGQTCTTELSTSDSDLTVTSNPGSEPDQDPGSQSETVDYGNPLSCQAEQYGSYAGFDSNWFTFSITGSAEKELTYDLYGVNPFESTVEICFGAKVEFTTNQGTAAAPGTLPDGSSGFIGLLPNCPEYNQVGGPAGPCIESRGAIYQPDSDNVEGTEVDVFIPQSFGDDPAIHG